MAERARIARDLHDLVAHHVSAIAMQARATAEALTDDPRSAGRGVDAIGTAADTALAEMRRLLGLLTDDRDGPDPAPEPSLRHLDRLAAAARAAGCRVAIEADPVGGVPPAVQVSAYRVVQEALTNVLRHAGATAVRVVLVREEGRLAVTVENGPPAPGRTPHRLRARAGRHARARGAVRRPPAGGPPGRRRMAGGGPVPLPGTGPACRDPAASSRGHRESAGSHRGRHGPSGSGMTPVRVLIADDQELVRAALRLMIERRADLTVAGEAADGQEAVAAALALRPDVVLMDVRMPGMTGVEATGRILGDWPHDGPRPRVLMLTTFDLDEYVHASLRAGASGFVLKNTTPDRLADAIRVVAAGEAALAPSVTRRIIGAVTALPAALLADVPRPAGERRGRMPGRRRRGGSAS
nr:hypothetical protein GCM10020093_003780 [Planobispora longispora]